jgi:hypothetical protein
MSRKKSQLASTLEYWTRQSGRAIGLIIVVFILFLVIVGIIWAAPKIWHLVFG